MATAPAAAKHICLSVSRFRDLVAAGVITHQSSGNYSLDEVREQYIPYLQEVASGRSGALSDQRVSLAQEQTAAIQLKNAALRGDLISLSTVLRSAQMIVSVARERFLSIPGKKADELSMRTAEEAELILRDEIHEALDELSRLTSLVGAAGGSAGVEVATGLSAAAEAQPY